MAKKIYDVVTRHTLEQSVVENKSAQARARSTIKDLNKYRESANLEANRTIYSSANALNAKLNLINKNASQQKINLDYIGLQSALKSGDQLAIANKIITEKMIADAKHLEHEKSEASKRATEKMLADAKRFEIEQGRINSRLISGVNSRTSTGGNATYTPLNMGGGGGGRSTPTPPPANVEGPRDISHSFMGTVKRAMITVPAFYAVATATIAIRDSFAAVISEIFRFNRSIHENMGILGMNKKEATDLALQVQDLGMKYGGAIDEIQKASITLGRAGVPGDQIGRYLENTIALAKITGDTLTISAEAVAAYKEVFVDAAKNVEVFGGKMAYIANETIMSMEGFKTVANYALGAANSMGMTYDTTLSLIGAFSKIGKQDSTIGTSIRRISQLTLDSSKDIEKFYRLIGVNQNQFKEDMAKDSSSAVESMTKWLSRLKSTDIERYNEAVKDLNIQMRATINDMALIGDSQAFTTFANKSIDAVAQAKEVAESMSATIEKLVNTVKVSATRMSQDYMAEVDKLFTAFNVNFPNAIEYANDVFKGFGIVVLTTIGTMIGALGVLGATIGMVVGGIAKLVGVVSEIAGKALGGMDSDGYTKMKQDYDKRKALHDEAHQYKDVYDKAEMKGMAAKLHAYEKNEGTLNKLVAMGRDVHKWGDGQVESTAKFTRQLTHLDTQLDKISTKAAVAKSKIKPVGKDLTPWVAVDKPIIVTPPSEELLQAQRENQVLLEKSKGTYDAIAWKQKDIAKDLIDINELKRKTTRYDDNRLAIAKLENKYLTDKTELVKLQQAAADKSSKKGASAAKAAIVENDRNIRDTLRVNAEQVKIDIAKAELASIINGRLEYKYEIQARNLKLAQLELDVTQEAYDKAKVQVGKSSFKDKPKAQKELLKAELAVVAAKIKVSRQINKELLDTASKFQQIFKSGFEDILHGNFESGLKSMFSGITSSLTSKLTDGLSTGLSNLLTGGGTAGLIGAFKDMSTGDWIGSALAIASSFLGNSVSEAQIEAARGQSASDITDRSLSNMVSAFTNAQYPMLEVSNSIFKHIRNMDNNFNSIARAISGATATSGIDITGAGVVEGIYDGGFMSSKTKELLGAGLVFKEQTLQAMSDINDIYVQGYESIKTTKSYIWKTSVTTSLKKTDLPPDVIESFANAFSDGYQTIMEAGVLLGLNEADLSDALNQATIKLGDAQGKIDLSGLDAQGVSDALNGIFSSAFSQVVNQIGDFSLLVKKYAKNTEQSLETLLRIAIEFDQASHMFGLIGKTFTDGTALIFEDITTTVTTQVAGHFGRLRDVTTYITETVSSLYTAQMQILDIVDSAGGLESFQDAMGAFMGSFYTEEEQLGFLTKSMEQSFATLGIAMPQTNEEFRNLLETMDTSTEEGAYLYGQVLLLADGFSQMSKATESLGTSMADMIKNVSDAWLSDLSYLTLFQKAEFTSGYLALARESNGTISTVDASRLAAETAMKTTTTKEEYIPVFERYVNELEKQAPKATTDDVVARLDSLIDRVIELEQTTRKVG